MLGTISLAVIAREVVAQALDYASWVESLTPDKIAQIYQRFTNGRSLDGDFKARFNAELDEESLNQNHQIVIVAAELDPASERIVKYLNDRNIAINVLFFQVFQHGSEQLLSRAWLLDPAETQVTAGSAPRGSTEKEPWNGEFYVSYGGAERRLWEEARRYGFISAGGGSWYSKTLDLLSPADRVWVKIPGVGYVGVGTVEGQAQPAKDFTIDTPAGPRPILDVLSAADEFRQFADDPDMTEYFVRVKWLATVPESEAFNEVGLFGNQNSVCRPQTPKWRHTIERLKTVFRAWDRQ